MYRLQPVEQRFDHRARHFLVVDAVVAAQMIGKAFAALVFHHHVGGAVGFEEAQHRHQVGVAKARQGARLVDEAIQAPAEILLRAARTGADLAAVAAQGNFGRQIFLDRDLLMQRRIECQIGNAKAAMAQHAHDAVIAQRMVGRQRLRIVVHLGHDKSSIRIAKPLINL